MSTVEGSGAAEFRPKFNVTEADKADIKHVKGAKQGKSRQRLSLGEKSTYNIAAKTLKGAPSRNPFRKMRYVTIKDGNENIEINIRSAAKRLGISHKEVRALAKDDNALQTLQDKAAIREAAIARYEEIVDDWSVEKSKLQSSGGHNTKLEPETVLKAVQKGLELKEGRFHTSPQQYKVGRHTFRITQEGDLTHLEKKLGAGNFGQVFRTFNLRRDTFEASKEAFGDQEAISQLQNERNVGLHLRNGLGEKTDLIGIFPCPGEISVISVGKVTTHTYQTHLASGDLTSGNSAMREFSILPASERLELCGQLIQGLSTCHQKNVYHADIKPENCLLVNDKNGKPERFYLGDFGGAGIGRSGRVSTPEFMPTDYDGRGGFLEWEKLDVFSTSLTIIETLLGGENLELPSKNIDGYNYPEPVKQNSQVAGELKTRLENRGIPTSFANTLIAGLSPKGMRPTAEALNRGWTEATQRMTPEESNAVDREAVFTYQLLKSL